MNEDQKPNDPVNEVASSSDTEKSPAQQVETKTEIENNATTSTEQQQAPEIAKKEKIFIARPDSSSAGSHRFWIVEKLPTGSA